VAGSSRTHKSPRSAYGNAARQQASTQESVFSTDGADELAVGSHRALEMLASHRVDRCDDVRIRVLVIHRRLYHAARARRGKRRQGMNRKIAAVHRGRRIFASPMKWSRIRRPAVLAERGFETIPKTR